MDLRAHARFSLQKSRNLAERLLDDFKTREDWLFQPHSKANHALWITAHIALADNQFGAVFRPDSARKPDGWDEWFWFGSQLREDTGVYPDHEEVYAYYRDRRETLLEVLDELTVDERRLRVVGGAKKDVLNGGKSKEKAKKPGPDLFVSIEIVVP